MTEAQTHTSQPAKKKSDLGPRVLTAVIAVPVVIYGIFSAPNLFRTLVLCASVIGTWEYLQIVQNDRHGYPWLKYAGAILSAILSICLVWFPDYLFVSLCLSVILPMTVLLFLHQKQTDATQILGTLISSLAYTSFPITALVLLYDKVGPAASPWILMSLGIVWGSDTFAYFGGRSLGKRKLSPEISPNKTVEGAISGLLGSVFVAFTFDALFSGITGGQLIHTHMFGLNFLPVTMQWQHLQWWQLLALAIPANILGQIGDLAESLLKRAHNVKDSGVIIYGHGGILDRLDGVMFASPWVYLCAVHLFTHFK